MASVILVIKISTKFLMETIDKSYYFGLHNVSSNYDMVDGNDIPAYFLVGSEDDKAPASIGRVMYDRCVERRLETEFAVIDGVGHGNVLGDDVAKETIFTVREPDYAMNIATVSLVFSAVIVIALYSSFFDNKIVYPASAYVKKFTWPVQKTYGATRQNSAILQGNFLPPSFLGYNFWYNFVFHLHYAAGTITGAEYIIFIILLAFLFVHNEVNKKNKYCVTVPSVCVTLFYFY